MEPIQIVDKAAANPIAVVPSTNLDMEEFCRVLIGSTVHSFLCRASAVQIASGFVLIMHGVLKRL